MLIKWEYMTKVSLADSHNYHSLLAKPGVRLLIHAGVCGPMQTVSLRGNIHFLMFTNNYTKMGWIYFFKNRSQVFKSFYKFKSLVEKQSDYFIKTLCTDIEKEFLSTEFKIYYEKHGVRRKLTRPYTLEKDVVAERKYKTVIEMAKTLLKVKIAPNEFWGEPVATTMHLLNISPTKAILNQTSCKHGKV